MRTNDQMVVDKLSEELLQLWEQYQLALESDEIFEVRKKIRIRIKEINGQLVDIKVVRAPDIIPPASS